MPPLCNIGIDMRKRTRAQAVRPVIDTPGMQTPRSDDLILPEAGNAGAMADLHVHSCYSHDVPNLPDFSPRALYARAVALGMGFFTLTDHDTLDGIEALQAELTKEFGGQPPIPVIPGVELKVRDPQVGHTIHVNVLGLDRRQMQALVARSMSVEHFVAYCRAEGLFHAYNHPFWFERGERPNLTAIDRLVALFPVIELNAGRIQELNSRTVAMARRHGKPVIATSDTHTGQLGKSFTLASGETAAAFLAEILAGRGKPFPTHIDFRSFLWEVSQTVDLFFRGAPLPRGERVLPSWSGRASRLLGRLIESRTLHRTRVSRRGMAALLKVSARAPAYYFIRQQRRMLPRLATTARDA